MFEYQCKQIPTRIVCESDKADRATELSIGHTLNEMSSQGWEFVCFQEFDLHIIGEQLEKIRYADRYEKVITAVFKRALK